MNAIYKKVKSTISLFWCMDSVLTYIIKCTMIPNLEDEHLMQGILHQHVKILLPLWLKCLGHNLLKCQENDSNDWLINYDMHTHAYPRGIHERNPLHLRRKTNLCVFHTQQNTYGNHKIHFLFTLVKLNAHLCFHDCLGLLHLEWYKRVQRFVRSS